MPIVIVERLACAIGMVAVMQAVAYVQNLGSIKQFNVNHQSTKI